MSLRVVFIRAKLRKKTKQKVTEGQNETIVSHKREDSKFKKRFNHTNLLHSKTFVLDEKTGEVFLVNKVRKSTASA